jgi:hypothetical protein
MLIKDLFKKMTKEQKKLIIKRYLILIIILSDFILLFSLIKGEFNKNKSDLSPNQISVFNEKNYKIYTVESLNYNYNIKYNKLKDLYLNGNESMLLNNEKIIIQSDLLYDSVVDLIMGEGRIGILKNLTHDLKNFSLVSSYILLFGVIFSAVFSALLFYHIVTLPGVWQILIFAISLYISYLFGLFVLILMVIFHIKYKYNK